MSERRNHLLLVGLIVLALAGAALLAVPGSPWKKDAVLGLDLQGGLEVVLKAEPPPGRQLQQADLDRSVEIIRDRIDRLGVSEPEIRTQGSDSIAVELPGVSNAEQARQVIGQTANLELYDLQPAATGPSTDAQGNVIARASLYDLLAANETQSLVRENGGQAFYLFEVPQEEEGEDAEGEQAPRGKLLAGPLPTREALLATDAAEASGAEGDEPGEGTRVFAVPSDTAVITCGNRGDFCPGVGAVPGNTTFYYLFNYTPNAEELENRFPQMGGGDLRLSGTRQDFDTTTGDPIVLMSFTDAGADKFQAITRAEAERGRNAYNLQAQGQGDPSPFFQNFAIVLDRELITAPYIDFTENPAGIPGTTGAQITMGNDENALEDAKEIALVLQTGALPVEFVTLSETEISATLGEDSLREAIRAAIAGLAAVAIFLLIAYRFLGVVAVLGLGVYAAFLYAMILLFNVTLTLPGFAGMILTIGVAADANIVIFERIKEEARGGKSVRGAIAAGYTKGFATIVDANVVTAITALVLFVLATAGVKGFALMLLIGTAISLLTAVFATRAMLGLLRGFRWFDSPKFMGATGEVIPKWIRHDYVGKRRIWFGISAVVMAISLGSLAWQGLNLGIDFEGGTEFSFQTAAPRTVEEVRAETEVIGQESAVIQGVGAEAAGGGYTDFQMRTEALEPPEARQLQASLSEAFDVSNFGSTTVSASFGEQIARSALLAVFFSLALVVLYITMRFQWKFAVGTIVAMLHDLVIAIGIYSLAGLEVTTATVAAILTVLGYSIYDTIIILDRVRENIPLMRRATMPTIANISLWETIRRSLATTFITLLPISALYFFGGATLKDFAFALLVGIGSGAYSSIFIAAPLVSWLKEREPEYARRREDIVDKRIGEAPATLPQAEPEPVAVGADGGGDGRGDALPLPGEAKAATSKRERRRQRRSTRPHGRAR